MKCRRCGSMSMVYVGRYTYACQDCGSTIRVDPDDEPRRMSPYERTKAQVYATGNKWAIENFNATHN